MTTIYRTLIIDDEPLARERLKKMLLPHSDRIEIVGEAQNGDQAVELIETLHPDLLFLDIQMPGKSGFEVLKEINHHPLVIFCTAFDDYALQAFETTGIDYLVKPVKEERLGKAIGKLDLLKAGNNHWDLEALLKEHLRQFAVKEINSIPVKIGDRVVFIRLDEIVFFAAGDKYVTIHTCEGKEYLIEHSLNYLIKKLGDEFVRVHRAFIVNTNFIKEIKRYVGGKYVLKLKDLKSSKIISGRNYQDDIKELMVF